MTFEEYEWIRKKWAEELKAAGKTVLTGRLLDIDGAVSALFSTYQGSPLGVSIVLEMIDRWRKELGGAAATDPASKAVAALEKRASATTRKKGAAVNLGSADFGLKVIAQRAVVLKSGQLPLKVQYPIEQKQQWPGKKLIEYKWSTFLEVSEQGHAIVVRVFAAYDTGRAGNESIKQSMKNVIESYWNVATVNLGDGRKAKDLVFDLTWVEAGSKVPHQSIAPKTTPVAAPSKPLTEMTPEKQKKYRDEVSEARGAGASLGTWDVDDRVEVIHEFGHMIGNPDEYYVKSFENVPSPYRAEIYDKPGFTTDSIMNNTDNYDKNSNKSYGKIYLRHFDTVKRAIVEYLGSTGRAGNSVSITL